MGLRPILDVSESHPPLKMHAKVENFRALLTLFFAREWKNPELFTAENSHYGFYQHWNPRFRS